MYYLRNIPGDAQKMSNVVTVNILFFAKARELVGINESKLKIQREIVYEALLDQLVKEYSLELLRNSLILAINEEYCTIGEVIRLEENDTIALIPPISGG